MQKDLYNDQNNKNCFNKQIEIRFYDCDKSHRARIETLLRYTADVAGIAYAAKGYSHEWLWERGFVFLLSRASFEIKRMPKADEALTLSTWEREVKGVCFYRDVVFYDNAGNEIVSASTAWTLVNPITRVILKPSAFTGKIDPHPNMKANCPEAARIKRPAATALCGTISKAQPARRKIVYSDIDGNGHVYNAIYAAIACDFLPDGLTEKNLVRFAINFKQEALLHDTLKIEQEITEDESGIKATVMGILEAGDNKEKESFLCELTYE